MSKIDTNHAALRWVNAENGKSEVTHCSLHNGWGFGIYLKNVKNILI
jgi:hypothetical protein